MCNDLRAAHPKFNRASAADGVACGTLDKLVGSLAHRKIDGGSGIVLLTSRISVEMVQKTAILGASILIAVSAPTALAVRVAEACRITLVAIARGQDFEIFSHPQRILALP